MGIATVRGESTDFEGALEIGDDLSQAKAYGTVKVVSMSTNEAQRGEHLRSACTATGEVVLHADVQGTDVDPWGNERVGLEVTGQLSREQYGMKFNQALGSGNALVSDGQARPRHLGGQTGVAVRVGPAAPGAGLASDAAPR